MFVCMRVRQRGRYYRFIPARLRRSLHRHSCLKFFVHFRVAAGVCVCVSARYWSPPVSRLPALLLSLWFPALHFSSSEALPLSISALRLSLLISTSLISLSHRLFLPPNEPSLHVFIAAFICSRFSPNPAFSLLLSNLVAVALPLGYRVAEQSFPIGLSNALKINGLRPCQSLNPSICTAFPMTRGKCNW